MSDEYEFSERRNKGKVKRKENRKYPYKKGGGHRVVVRQEVK